MAIFFNIFRCLIAALRLRSFSMRPALLCLGLFAILQIYYNIQLVKLRRLQNRRSVNHCIAA